MKTKDYVRVFKLDKPFYEFSREKFLNEFGKEFQQKVDDVKRDRENQGLEFTFSYFNKLIKEMERKFWAISNKKQGAPFSEKLFGSFFAGWVIPIRKKYFPKEDEELTRQWEERKRKREEKEKESHQGNQDILEKELENLW